VSIRGGLMRILAWDRLPHSSKFATGLMPAA
jgi:hypothetical protein